MSNPPCKDCICLAICKAKYIKTDFIFYIFNECSIVRSYLNINQIHKTTFTHNSTNQSIVGFNQTRLDKTMAFFDKGVDE